MHIVGATAMDNRNSMLYPLMILAAVSVIIFSIIGVATMTGHVPSAFSSPQKVTDAGQAEANGSALDGRQPSSGRQVLVASNCGNCGVIESIREIEAKGQGSGVGLALGGVTGGLLGTQIGHGGGRAAATILGVAGGAYVGNEVEKNAKKSSVFRVTLRMEDGTYRTVTQRNYPGHGVGEQVKLVDGNIVSRG
jgi:outer membrane lipoprotein SlyB